MINMTPELEYNDYFKTTFHGWILRYLQDFASFGHIGTEKLQIILVDYNESFNMALISRPPYTHMKKN